MSKRILLIQGHPDSRTSHLCHALAASYKGGAQSGGHAVRLCHVAALDFPLLRSQIDFKTGYLPRSLQTAQDDIWWCEHMVFFFPLWAGDMPALLKGFLEQVFRPSFTGSNRNPFAKKPLSGRSAQVVVTMAMPALVYRLLFRAHSLKSLRRNILGMAGIGPVRETLIGSAGGMQAQKAAQWFFKLRRLSEDGK
ncbi:NAD(P)H-dependent oxidoreductase [Rhodoferax sp. OV413]|uniref:NAD(P)H-dependent oxidoreductase n=1 Tax=Rhodoferax sp. OV413 TaxID=1855285 RepID=UPI0025FA7061|nr:NAD(P)H-dependent oxidoreductase [Rhodoferax sp. OV413]